MLPYATLYPSEMRRIYGSHPLTIPEGNYLGGEEQNTGFLHLIFSPLFFIEFGGNLQYTDSLVLFVHTTDSSKSLRFPENMVLFVE